MTQARSRLAFGAILALGVLIGGAMDRAMSRLGAQNAAPADRTLRNVADSNPAAASVRAPSADDLYDRLARQYDRFSEVDRTFTLVAQAVSPAVVHIVARKAGPVTDRETGSRIIEETGSGVVVRPDGRDEVIILTNYHVVAHAATNDIRVTLQDGRELSVLQCQTDPKADIAVLEVGRNDLATARLGDSDQAAVGSWVLALGSPFGLTHSVSQGIISARNRHEAELENEGVQNQEFLQTDAAINPGNSGGPLVNLKGEVIGINTAIESQGGGNEGVGLSIPINMARWIMMQLVSNHRVNRGALGVRLQDLEPRVATDIGLDRPRGARILSVQDASPAREAGIRPGDVVLRFNQTEVLDINHLINLVSMAGIGQKAALVVWRDKQTLEVQVTIADRESMVVDDSPEPRSVVAPVNGTSHPAPPVPTENVLP